MTRLITTEELEEHFTMEKCIASLEKMYKEWARSHATTSAVQSVISPVSDSPEDAVDPVYYALKSMNGVIQESEISTVRINSDVIHYPEVGGSKRRDKIPAAGGRYTGLILVFSTITGEPLAIFPDGYVQSHRVAGDSVLGAKYLSREDSKTLGLIGAGQQARAHLLAYDVVRDLETVQVYSTTSSSREEFAEEMDGEVTPSVQAVDDPQTVFEGTDIIQCATSSTTPVFEMGWLEPGTHIGIIKDGEAPKEFWDPNNHDQLARDYTMTTQHEVQGNYISENDRPLRPWDYYVIEGDEPYPKLEERYTSGEPPFDWTDVPGIGEVMIGDSPGRTHEDDVTAFYNGGSGLEFTAVGEAVHKIAEENDLGKFIETELLTQEYHP